MSKKTWQDYLRDSERLQLERVKEIRDLAKEIHNAETSKVKSRCESRMRSEAARVAAQNGGENEKG